MLQLTVNSFSTVDSITFVLCKSHFRVCTFDHIPMLKYDLGPLHMSPVDRAGSVTGMNFVLGSYEKFQPGFRDEKRSKILGTSSGAKFGNKANMPKHKNFNFRAYLTIGNS